MSLIIDFIIGYLIGRILGYILAGLIVFWCVYHLGTRHVWPWEDDIPVVDPVAVEVGRDGWVSPITVWAQKNKIDEDTCNEMGEFIDGGWEWEWRTATCEKNYDLPMGRSVNLPEGTELTIAQVQSLYPEWNPDATSPY